jgi:hypothetical protein
MNKIWLIDIDKPERVCTSCWNKFIQVDKIENNGRGLEKMDKAMKDKLDHIDDFLKWIKDEECKVSRDKILGTPAKVKDTKVKSSITCHQCKKVMMRFHVCYRNKMEEVDHTLDRKDLCHWCWDKHLLAAVECAGY